MKAPVEGIPPVQDSAQTTSQASQVEPKVNQDAERFNQLARKEKSLRAQARQLQEQKRQLDEMQYKAQSQQDDWKPRLKTDLVGLLAEAGMTHEEAANALLNARPEDMQMRQLKAEIQSLRDAQNKTVSEAEASQKRAYDQAVKQLTREVNILVGSNEAFETIQATKSQDAVVALIERTYKEDGILLSANEAAQQVEDYLLEEALNVSKLKKVQSKLSPPVEQIPAQKTQQVRSEPTKTLTNAISQMSSSSLAKDKRMRAIAAFQGQLK